MRQERVPIYVIGGFLGSGKTTLLRRLIRHTVVGGVRPSVLVNDLPHTRMDEGLQVDHAIDQAFDLRSLNQSCICCDWSGELAEQVALLVRTSEGPIFVEATGLASMERIAHAVSTAVASGGGGGRLAAVIAVVDAALLGSDDADGSAFADLGVADVVVLNKVDGVAPSVVATAESRVRNRRPSARIVRGSVTNVASLLIDVRRPEVDEEAGPPLVSDPSRGHLSVTVKLLGPVAIDRLAAVFAKYQPGLVRAKGIVRSTDRWGYQELQWVPGALALSPGRKAKGTTCDLVVVGRGVDWDSFATDLDSCVEMSSCRPGRRS
jgi:G3E family GTPase